MHFTITITVNVERVSGKFASRETIEDNLRAELEGAEPSTLYIDDPEAEYEVTEWEIDIADPPKRQRRRRGSRSAGSAS